MKFLNQLEYPHVPYRTRAKVEGLTDEERTTNVAESGCGLCCASMVVDLLTDKTLTIEDSVRLSEECVANHSPGTDLAVLAPALAEKFGLCYKQSNDLEETIAHLKNGGVAVALTVIKEGKKISLFAEYGHYILLVSTDGKDFCILDPYYKLEKFDIPERAGKVDVSCAPFLYCDVNVVDGECLARKKYFLFSRKKS